ncbi:MAG: hypothetical protein IJK05_09745 [Bacteroidales bacterium]|nr:hypothetical protein [Bacteroidales bacterium]
MKRILRALMVTVFLLSGLAACGPDEKEVKTIIQQEDPKPDPDPDQGNGNGNENQNQQQTGYKYVDVTFVTSAAHNVAMSKVGDKEYKLTLSGEDPYIFTASLASDLGDDLKVVEFDYKYAFDIDIFQIFFALNGAPSEASSEKYGSLPSSSSYKTFKASISKFRKAGWGKKGDCLRFDPGQTGKGDMYVKNFIIREMTDEEKKAEEESNANENAKIQMAKNLSDYLAKEYSSSVSKVTVTSDKVTVEGRIGGPGTFVLADICPWQDVTEMKTFPYSESIEGGSFKVTLDRVVKSREGINYDRVFSKWAVVKVEGESQTLDSHARYADEVEPVESPEAVPLKNKKGLGAGNINLYYEDCKEMNCGSVTMNVLLNGFIDRQGADYVYGGVPYAIGNWKAEVDRMTAKCKEAGVVVAAIILTPTESSYKDPENMGGYYTMPNLTDAKSFNMYAAALTYMASRYCKDNPGRIHHWIMHNEVDMGSDWTNMGDQPMMRYLDRYIKSMRICYNIVRQYDQNAYILGSYTHNWNQADGNYRPKEMLEKTVDYSLAEGDFQWGVAYHPYPQDLTKPEFWKNDTQSTWDMDTKYITFKNLEVIDKWIKQPRNLYKGETKRLLFLSEQGTNSPSYSDRDLELQAAGGAWAWKKAAELDGIDGIQWHNWADNKAEFGLRIGLRSFDEGSWESLTPKPVWHVWKAAGTDEESKVFDPYLSTLGLSSWDQIMRRMD